MPTGRRSTSSSSGNYWALLDVPMPVIAAVNGHAYAGGLEMMLACDFAYAVPNARFALTEVTLGIMPGAGGTQILPRAVGERRAKEIILTGRPFTAEEALALGPRQPRLCAPEALMDAALATAARSPTTRRSRCARPRSRSIPGCSCDLPQRLPVRDRGL